MTTQQQRDRAEQFRQLHQRGALLLPNAWDAASARIFETAGFPAIGTTSAGIAYANGYHDGQQIGRNDMLQAIARITAVVQTPVTADIEAGYGHTAADVAATVREVISAGVVGINLEDNRRDPESLLYSIEEQSARIAAARAEALRADLPLVINARIDTYIANVGKGEARLAETALRARAYLQAGADVVFVPFVVDPPTIQTLVQQIPGPLNIMVGPGAPSASELFQLGVTRVSIGASAALATLGLVRDIARELRDHGSYETIARHFFTFSELRALLTGA